MASNTRPQDPKWVSLALISLLLLTPFTSVSQDVSSVSEQEKDVEVIQVIASALKVTTPMAEIPQSVSVVTERDLEFRKVGKLDETFRYSAGVLSAPFGADNDTDWIRVRGFEAATYLDASRLFQDGFYTWLLEPYGLESVELLKGPASILYGEAPPGGVTNAVQKKPKSEAGGEVLLQVGSNSHNQAGVDIYGAMGDSADNRFRLVGMYLQEDGELDFSENERIFLAPSFAFDFSTSTSLTVMATYLVDDGIPTNPFFPAYGTQINAEQGEIERETNLGEPSYDNYERTQVSLGYQLDHDVNQTWTFTQRFNYGYNELDLTSVYAFWNNDAPGDNLFRGVTFRDGEVESYTLDNRALAEWIGDTVEHTLLIGVDLQSHQNDGVEQDSFAFSPINPFEPVYGNFTPLDPANNIEREISKDQYSLYGKYQLKFSDRWIAVLGARLDSVDTENNNVTFSTSQDRSDEEVSLNAGLMYVADNGISPYISYAESFEVISVQDPATNSLYEPLDGDQLEIGVKYEPDFINGYINIAYFDIEQTNALVTNPNTFVTTQTGKATSEGFEFESVMFVTDELRINANYSYTDARSDEAFGTRTDRRAPLVPRHQASLWLDYDAAGLGVDGLQIGTGLRYVGESVDNTENVSFLGTTVPEVDAYTLWDAVVQYQIDNHWQAQLNVNNLTDNDAVSSCDYWCYIVESRNVVASIQYNW